MVKVLGITGGVGSGKSRVTQLAADVTGARVFIADNMGHVVMEPGRDCYNEIVKEFGDEILADDATIDRKKLGSVVFSDKANIEILNSIVHPAIDKLTDDFIEDAEKEGCKLIIMESALPEGKFKDVCDEVWYVYVPQSIRIDRLTESRGYTVKRCEEIFNKQPSEDRYKEIADVVIDNSGNWEDTENEIRKLCERKFR